MGEAAIPEHLKTGLKDFEAIRGEIEAFKAATCGAEPAPTAKAAEAEAATPETMQAA